MHLSHHKESLESMSNSELLFAIRERRNYLRWHRDQKMDDRCWIDDLGLWAFLLDTLPHEGKIPSFEEGMRACREFYARRRAEAPDPIPQNTLLEKEKWDADLRAMRHAELVEVLFALQQSIRAHRDISSQKRTLEGDRALYALLPEKLPADFRLPPEPEFLGEAKAPKAGCPSFWRSHQNCPAEKHDLHRWGPCQ